MLFLIFSGIRQIYGYHRGKKCPKCNYTPVLSIDDPEALKLIKEYDLQPGENNVVKNKNEGESTSPSKIT